MEINKTTSLKQIHQHKKIESVFIFYIDLCYDPPSGLSFNAECFLFFAKIGIVSTLKNIRFISIQRKSNSHIWKIKIYNFYILISLLMKLVFTNQNLIT